MVTVKLAEYTCRTLTGAWIETPMSGWLCAKAAVAPSRVRGLKHALWQGHIYRCPRRTLTGAWIETADGVKSMSEEPVAPSRVRGLKLVQTQSQLLAEGRTLTGAWIETCQEAAIRYQALRRTLTGAWIETLKAEGEPGSMEVAPSRVRGLKQVGVINVTGIKVSHPHGCVD